MPEAEFPIIGGQRQMVEAIMRHEVGHHIIARRLGFEPTDISFKLLDVGGNYDGGAYLPMVGLRSLEDFENFFEKRVQMLLAGAFSESVKGGKVDVDAAHGILSAGGTVDYHKAHEFVGILRGMRYSDAPSSTEADEYQEALWLHLWGKTRDLVEADHDLIIQLAAELAKKVVLGGKQYVFRRDELDAFPMVREGF